MDGVDLSLLSSCQLYVEPRNEVSLVEAPTRSETKEVGDWIVVPRFGLLEISGRGMDGVGPPTPVSARCSQRIEAP